MKNYKSTNIRNIAVTGHGKTGKTSLLDACLFNTGVVKRLGSVEDGTSALDYDPEESKRKMTIGAKLVACEWRDFKLNFIDTPGYPDFVGEVHAALSVAGAAVIAGGLLSLPAIAAHYGEEPCGSLRLGNVMLLYVIAIVKFSDVGGFAFGLTSARLMKGGNHKLCPSISPGKSWEGLFGSLVCSCAVSCAFIPASGFGVGKALAFGCAAALVGTAGDLVESKFKRWVGVKDSSTLKITSGMGGILDMLDSLIFAPAVLLPFL